MVDAKTHALGHVGVAITFGLVIMAMIYAVGHISGAHFNAAVTFAFALTRHFPWRRALGYWSARLARQHRACGSDAAVGLAGAVLRMGAGDDRVPDVRRPRGRDRYACGGGGGGDRDRRHDRARRDVRRPDLGRL